MCASSSTTKNGGWNWACVTIGLFRPRVKCVKTAGRGRDGRFRIRPPRDGDEFLHEGRALPPPCDVLTQLVTRLVGRHRRLVGTFRRHRIVGIDDAHDLGEEGDPIAGQFVWIARSVKSLMMVTYDRTDVF